MSKPSFDINIASTYTEKKIITREYFVTFDQIEELLTKALGLEKKDFSFNWDNMDHLIIEEKIELDGNKHTSIVQL